MSQLAKWLATVGGLGHMPLAPGTIGSVAGVVLAFLGIWTLAPLANLGCAVGLCLIGIWAADHTARELGDPDPSCVVIDETAAMWVILALLPHLMPVWWMVVVAFVLFRIFDVIKPPPLKWLETFPGGWGIMLDDLGAAAYVCLILWIVATRWV